MKKSRKLTILFTGVISLLAVTITLSIGMTIALYEKYVQGNGTYGEISLRSYYECGSGRPPKTNGRNPKDFKDLKDSKDLSGGGRMLGAPVSGELAALAD